MKTECTPRQLEFPGVGRRRIVARFDGGAISSDAGALLLKEVEARTSRGSRPLSAALRSNASRSSPADHVSDACAAYSNSCPTMVRRTSELEPRLTSTSVGTAS